MNDKLFRDVVQIYWENFKMKLEFFWIDLKWYCDRLLKTLKFW